MRTTDERLSLCQSLRQYVFVHRAIIEGSLEIADKEREREGGEVHLTEIRMFLLASELYLTSAIGSGTFSQARGRVKIREEVVVE